MKKVAILGTGAMGSRIAANLLRKGYKLNIWNRTPERCMPLIEQGAKQYPFPKDAVRNADVVIAMLSNDDASRNVWMDKITGATLGLKKGAIAIECSTLSLAWCLELSEYIHEFQADFLDAPVVGSRPQAEASQLIHLVGGDNIILEKVHNIISASSSAIHYAGETGSGMSMKLAINGLFGIQVAAFGEIIGMLNKLGISKDSAVNLLNELPVTSPALKGIGLAISSGNFDPLFPIDLVEKDFGYLEKLAKSSNSGIPLVNITRDIYQQAIKSGYGENNIAGVAQLYL